MNVQKAIERLQVAKRFSVRLAGRMLEKEIEKLLSEKTSYRNALASALYETECIYRGGCPAACGMSECVEYYTEQTSNSIVSDKEATDEI